MIVSIKLNDTEIVSLKQSMFTQMETMHTCNSDHLSHAYNGSSAALGSLVRERVSERSLCEESESMLCSGPERTSE